MGVSAGDGMIHYVLLTRDDVGRSVVDTRVIDVDRSDGLDVAGRVNAGIDLMLGAARDANLRVGPIGVAARTTKQRWELQSRGAGPRRQIHLVNDDEAVVAYLSATGQITRFESVVVVDCGDTGMSLYTVEPATSRISATERSRALTGRRLDRSIVEQLVTDESVAESMGARTRRRALLSACRTAKEEFSAPTPSAEAGSILLADGGGHVTLTQDTIDAAIAPMIDEARGVLARYLSDGADRGPRPQAVVLVGGIANLPAVRAMVDRDQTLEVIVPEAPELAASVGAAILARAKTTVESPSRLAFIGGKRNREWLSATPLAVVGAIIAAAMMTVFAVSSSLTGQNEPAPSSTAAPETSSTTSSAVTTSRAPQQPIPTTTAAVVPPPVVQIPTEEQVVPRTRRPEPRWNESPGWATTELPPTTQQPDQPSTTTRTLLPYPLPSLPWPTGTRPTPTIPPDLLPPGFAPQTTQPTPAPPQQAPATTSPRGAQRQMTPSAPTSEDAPESTTSTPVPSR
ncbi:Hsp70 family protein [Gordonia sp. SID5947]|uniref:Hsp70 family protein n=1 Tax=Gordonia sp. SID5947 TaxID=2690315 RepID=UPI00136F3890|nr:Hsp70 family protein [Gordonia sp. SID5947]MYR06218.1 Hsp70 family protein [Gordonia sp. SID5947]